MNRILIAAVAVAVILVLWSAAPGSAAVITFAGLSEGAVPDTFSEGGFNFTVQTGDSWQNLNRSGTGTIEGSTTTASIEITAVGGIDFRFIEMVAGGFGTGGSQPILLYATKDGAEVFLATPGMSIDTFSTIASPDAVSYIDTLLIGTGPRPEQNEVLDSITLEPIPEPGSATLLVLGLGSLIARIRSRWWTS